MRIVINRPVNSSNWWLLTLQAIVAAIIGIAIVAWPQLTLAVFIYLFGGFAVVNGIFAIGLAILERKEMPGWWALLLGGLAGIFVGIVVFVYPQVTGQFMVYLVATWALFVGLAYLAGVFSSGYTPTQRVANALIGVLSIALAIWLFVRPGKSVLSLTWLIGAFCIVYGLLLLIHVMFPGSSVSTLSKGPEALLESVDMHSQE